MKAPLPQKKQGHQKAFTAPPQVVVNHKSGAQHYPDEVQDRVGEVAGIGSDDHHRIGKAVQLGTRPPVVSRCVGKPILLASGGPFFPILNY